MVKNFISHKAPDPVGKYPHCKRVGEFLFFSGMGPRKKGQKNIPGVQLDQQGNVSSYDFIEQCHSVFQNLEILLEENGLKFEHLVDVTIYLTNMKKDFSTFNKIWSEYFEDLALAPTRTTVEINALPTPIAIELKCVAYFPQKVS